MGTDGNQLFQFLCCNLDDQFAPIGSIIAQKNFMKAKKLPTFNYKKLSSACNSFKIQMNLFLISLGGICTVTNFLTIFVHIDNLSEKKFWDPNKRMSKIFFFFNC